MFNTLDRILPWLFWLCMGFVIMSLGIVVAHYHWAPSGLYEYVVDYFDRTSHPNNKHKNNNTKPVKNSDAITDNSQPSKTSPGYTLITKEDDTIILVDMDGKVVHSWHLPFEKVWSVSSKNDLRFSKSPYFAYAELSANGDIMAIYHSRNQKKGQSIAGAGLVKMNKDSKVLWSFGANVHDAFYKTSDGRIFTLVQSLDRAPAQGVEYVTKPTMTDSISIISPEGHEEREIPIIQAFLGTAYEEYLYATGNNIRYIGANSIQVLESGMAEAFPLFKKGDILVSIGSMHTIAVIDPESGKVRWASRGMWRKQYDARFVADGNIMLYDTAGYNDHSQINRGRVLQVNPANQGISWYYVDKDKSEPTTRMAGMSQQLSNNNILITEDDAAQVTEVTPQGEKVWQYTYPIRITSAQRVSYDYVDKSVWGSNSVKDQDQLGPSTKSKEERVNSEEKGGKTSSVEDNDADNSDGDDEGEKQ